MTPTPARIAIVDDDPAFSQYMSMLLGSRGYDVTSYQSGSALLDGLGRVAAIPDIVLLDMLMPGMDGLETLRAIRAAHPGLPVIMVSGTQVPSTIVDAVRLGAVDYVLKPDDPEGLGEVALEATIRSAIEKASLSSEVAQLRAQVVDDPDGSQPCWGSGAAMRRVLTMVERVADSDVSVLITGESGVGKEVIARELHRQSVRRTRPFVKVNCAALPAELLESELFGHERGAFTGAQNSRVGKFEFANQGTIMLDEIGEMPLALQAKLLHVLQDQEFTKLGSNRPITVDVRVIAATNRDLAQMIRIGQFREDLYYRLQVIEIRVPSLRERRDEIVPLSEFFLLQYASRYRRPAARPSPTLRDAFVTYAWPGNVRELENVIKRFVILRDEGLVLAELQRSRSQDQPTVSEVPVSPAEETRPTPTFDPEPPADAAASGNGADGLLPDLARRAAMTAERDAITRTLDHFRWNRRKAAVRLGVSYKTLLNKMRECGISAPPK